MSPESAAPNDSAESTGYSRLHSATLACENCGRTTPHRILRLDRASASAGTHLQGVARCRVCGWTHAFDVRRERHVRLTEIVSEGPTSTRRGIEVPHGRRLQVGSDVPGSEERARIVRIDLRSGESAPAAVAHEIATVWTVPDRGAVVPVSIVEGRRTRPARLVLPPETRIEVGATMRVEATAVEVVAIRARRTNWRRPGDAFPAREVQRVYARRTEIPPAGRSDWSRGRGSPRSRASATSSRDRSASGPGVRYARTRPRSVKADGGATVHSGSPS